MIGPPGGNRRRCPFSAWIRKPIAEATAAAPVNLYDLVWFPSSEWTAELAAIALPENWDDEGSGRHPILFNYELTVRSQAGGEELLRELGALAEVRAAILAH
jgi:hypothetical protein